ncbi:uncharacterized protein RCO7_03885 [Rhynchosporium graminicola]|uniref:Uncharacterized protein n=1 Tax=Rhynchosporium graminicola TaxID=2792576 RepID=A0A1E1LLK5_9HELO|nr:uncharacterized protein RCO7_03885 [Rhynchosporium commune]
MAPRNHNLEAWFQRETGQGKTPDSGSHSSRTPCVSLALSSPFILNLEPISSTVSDLSALIDASDVSRSIATDYHALTIEGLQQHNKSNYPLHRRFADIPTTPANNTSHISASFEKISVDMVTPFNSSAALGSIQITPLEYFEAYPSPLYLQLNNYQPLDVQSVSNVSGTPAEPDSDCTVIASFGDHELIDANLACWEKDREQPFCEGRYDRELTELGENLSGIGTQFDVHPSNSPI